MTRLIVRRLIMLIPMVWLVATLTFVVVHAAPGSIADLLDHPRLSPEARELIRHRFGLDLSLTQRYFRWLGSIAHGDLGVSFQYRQPVATVIKSALPPTILLAGSALLLDLVMGLALAIAAVRRPDGWLDRTITVLGLTLYGMPSFWLAGLVILLFSLLLGWLPPSHMYSVGAEQLSRSAQLVDLLRHLVLPASCLGLVGAAATARYLRATLLDLREASFVLAARARGLSERRILWRHSLKPALLPVITLLGLSLPFLVSGSVVIEVLFSWPGMGRVLWNAAWARDLPIILGVTLVGATAVIVGNLVADVLYAVVDPRARCSS